MKRAAVIVAAAATAATCYRPAAEQPCSISCDHLSDVACPGDMTCMADNRCHPPGVTSCEPIVDASIDSSIDASGSSGSACFGTGIVELCFPGEPAGVVHPQRVIDTTAGSGCEIVTPVKGAATVCVIKGGAIIVDDDVFATGMWPLVLVSATTITVNAPLSVASQRGAVAGAGTDLTCTATAGTADFGAGGGGGGSFGTAGGAGGTGSVGAGGGTTSATSGFHGGCAGGDGGASAANAGGLGGAGGGAMYLIAKTEIDVLGGGTINASGEAGGGGNPGAGGGGGGAGGFIGLDAPTIMQGGIVVAGGGGGGAGQAGGAGITTPGEPGQESATCTEAGGGIGVIVNDGETGGNGGTASVSSMDGRSGGNAGGASSGGGGGGGGAGVLRIDSSGPHAIGECPVAP